MQYILLLAWLQGSNIMADTKFDAYWYHATHYDAAHFAALQESDLLVAAEQTTNLHDRVVSLVTLCKYYHAHNRNFELFETLGHLVSNTFRFAERLPGQDSLFVGCINLGIEYAHIHYRMQLVFRFLEDVQQIVPNWKQHGAAGLSLEWNRQKVMLKTRVHGEIPESVLRQRKDLLEEMLRYNAFYHAGELMGLLVYDGLWDAVGAEKWVKQMPPYAQGRYYLHLANKAKQEGRQDVVKANLRKMAATGGAYNYFALFRANLEISELYKRNGNYDSAWHYLALARAAAPLVNDFEVTRHLVSELGRWYQFIGNADSTAMYRDSLEALNRVYAVRMNSATESINRLLLQELDVTNRNLKAQNIRIIAMSAGLVLLLVVLVFVLIRTYRQQRQLARLTADQTMLLGMMAHDLRAPLASIRTLGHSDLTEFGNRQAINRELNRLQFTMDNLLKWALSQMSRPEPHPVRFDLVELLEETIDQVEGLADKRGMTIVPQYHTETEAICYADPDMMEVCLRNMLANAIQHGQESTTIVLALDQQPELVKVTITNRVISNGMSKVEPSLGLRLIHKFSTVNKATFNFNRQGETVTTVLAIPRSQR